MFKLINNLWQDDNGAAAAEYALILAIVGAVLATAMVGLRREIVSTIDTASAEIVAARGEMTGS